MQDWRVLFVLWEKEKWKMRKQNRTLGFFALFIVCCLFSSCATMVSGTRADLLIDGECYEPVRVETQDETYDSLMIPAVVSVKRSQLNKPLHITSENYVYSDIIPGSKTNEWIWANWFCGFWGIAVDAATGAIYKPALPCYSIRTRHKDECSDSTSMPPVDGKAMLAASRKIQRCYRHEVDVVFGFGSIIADGVHQRRIRELEKMNFGDAYYCGFPEYGGAVGLRYYYHLNRWVAVGGMAGYAHAHDLLDHYYDGNPSNVPDYSSCDVNTESFYLAPSVKASWWHSGALTCYSKGALGLQLRHHWTTLHTPRYWPDGQTVKNNSIENRSLCDMRQWRLSGQFTAVGVDVGSRHLRFFAELGYGIEGVFNIGLSYRFGRFGK